MRTFQIRLWLENNWFIAQCLDIDISSQGGSESEVLENIEEALRLHFQEPCANVSLMDTQLQTHVPSDATVCEVSIEV